MAQAEEHRVQRLAAMRGHPDQPRGRHHPGDPLLGQVGAVIELVEARSLLEGAGEQHQVAVVYRRHAVDDGFDSQVARHVAVAG